MLNAHPSLLPAYRGAAPLQHTIMNGDTLSGVTIIDLDAKEFDAGNIWLQEAIPIAPYAEYRVLEEQMAIKSGDLFFQALQGFDSLQVYSSVPRHSFSRRSDPLRFILHGPRIGITTTTAGDGNLCPKDKP